jgi:hypothetical protein
MRASRLTAFVLAQVILVPGRLHAQAQTQDDTLARAWEPAAITGLALPSAKSAAGAPADSRLTPDALQGPPTPAMMYAIASLDRDQLSRYVAAYQVHMSATWDARYGVASAVKLLSQAVERGDEDAARYYGAVTDRLWSRVVEEDRRFDDVVESLLRKGQRKEYRQWKVRVARGADEQGRLEGAPPPG